MKIYNLCLQHGPQDLESVLKENSRWDTIMADQDGIGLLRVIRDIPHKKYEKMHITMSYFKAFLELATTYQEPQQSNTDYYALFKSGQDTVTVHGGQPGYHLELYDKHWKRLIVT